MTLTADEVGRGLLDEVQRFSALVAQLDDRDGQRRTVFWGLPVHDVAAHAAGVITDVVRGNTDGLATPRAVARQLIERHAATPSQLHRELADGHAAGTALLAALAADIWSTPAPGGFDGDFIHAVEALWEDFWLHGDDIRTAIGVDSDRGPGLRASVHHLARLLERRDWGPATLTLDGVEPITVPGVGQPRRIEGDPVTFVRIATSRADPSLLGLDASAVVAT